MKCRLYFDIADVSNKENIMKKSTAYFCTGALLFALAACGAQDNTNSTGSQTETLMNDPDFDKDETDNGDPDDKNAPPEMPDKEGGAPNGKNAPPDGNDKGPGAKGDAKGGPGFGGSHEVTQGDSANTISKDSI